MACCYFVVESFLVTGSGGTATDALARGVMPRRAGIRDPLLRARMAVPQTRTGTVSRSSLAGLVCTQRPALAAVSAPAGYGKSTLMVEWARHDRASRRGSRSTATDNDPAGLLRLVAGAIDALSPVDVAVLNDLGSPGVSILGRVVPALAASLLTAEPFLLLLDDLHEVDDQACRDALTLLVDRLPRARR